MAAWLDEAAAVAEALEFIGTPEVKLRPQEVLTLAEVVKAARPFQRPVAAQTLGEYQRLDNALARLEELD